MARVHDLLEQAARRQTAALMGIVNVTPDSFFDGGRHATQSAVREHVVRLLAEGADILDIGGESSRPGAPAVPAAEQLARILEPLQFAVSRGAIVSVDTAHPEVAEQTLRQGACIINDVTCLSDPGLAEAVARHQAYLILSHARAHQSRMAGFSQWPDADYTDVVAEVRSELKAARARAVECGVSPDHVWFDPGLGFSKNARHSLELLARLHELSDDGTPILVGTGRKSFIGSLDGSAPEDRLGGTIAASLWAAQRGAFCVRVHDVGAVRQALHVQAELQRRREARGAAAR